MKIQTWIKQISDKGFNKTKGNYGENVTKGFRGKPLVAAAILLTLGTFALTGCSKNSYEALKAAQDKTEAAQTGVLDMKMTLKNELDTSTMDQEDLKMANYMKSIAYEGSTTYDEAQDMAISESWINMGGIGFDFTYYGKGEEQYIHYPVLKKYIDLKQMAKSQSEKGLTSIPELSPETQKALSEIWDKLESKETVKQVEETIVTTASGDVKATHYEVEASGEAVKAAILESQELIKADPAVKQWVEKQKEKSQDKEVQNMDFGIDQSLEIGDFNLSSYVDSDGYLIKEEVKVSVKGSGKENTHWLGSEYFMSITYSQLGQKVSLDFPSITPDMVMTEEELNKDMPAVFSDLFK